MFKWTYDQQKRWEDVSGRTEPPLICVDLTGLTFARDGMLYREDCVPGFRNDLVVNDRVSLLRGSTETT